LDGEEAEALWGYLCNEWDRENNVSEDNNQGRKLLRYNFFMLQADVLPNMGFSSTRKRLVYSHECVAAKEEDEEQDGLHNGKDNGNDNDNDGQASTGVGQEL